MKRLIINISSHCLYRPLQFSQLEKCLFINNSNRYYSSSLNNNDYSYFFQKKVELIEKDDERLLPYNIDTKIELIKGRSDNDNLEIVKNKIEILSLLNIFKDKFCVSNIYQSIFQEIIEFGKFETMSDQIILHLFQLGYDKYDILNIELRTNWNKIISNIVSELIFINEVNTNINNSNIILNQIKKNLEKEPNLQLINFTISKLIVLLLKFGKYETALKWASIIIEKYLIKPEFIYQHFRIYHKTQQSQQLTEYWENLINHTEKVKETKINQVEKEKQIFQIELEFKELNPNLSDIINNRNNSIINENDKLIESLIKRKEIDELIQIMNKEYFTNNEIKSIPNGELLIKVSEIIRKEDTIKHGYWYSLNIPKKLKPLIYHKDKYELIMYDLESGLDIMVNEIIKERKSIQELSNNNQILISVVIGLLKLNQFKLASQVLQKLTHNLYIQPFQDTNGSIISNTSNTSTTKEMNEFNEFFKKYINIKDCKVELTNLQNGDYCRLLDYQYDCILKLQKSKSYEIPIQILNMVLSNYLKRKEVDKGLMLFEAMVIKDEITLDIGLELTSHRYPVPPIDNFLYWQNLNTHYLENNIKVDKFLNSLLRVLKSKNKYDLILKLYERNTFKQDILIKLSQDSLLSILESFGKNYGKVIQVFQQYNSQSFYNKSLIDYLSKVNYHVENQDVYQFIKKVKRNPSISIINDQQPIAHNLIDNLKNEKTVKFFNKILK